MKPKISIMSTVPDADWQAEHDARVLAEAMAIMSDPKRHEAAVKVAAKMAKEKMADVKAMQRVASKKIRPETDKTNLRSES